MKSVTVVALALLATGLQAQTFRRQAAIVGGGDRDRGRCFVEVIVDGAAELAMRGDDMTVTNLKGAAPDVRRFECSSPIPRGPLEFRYGPLGGRGRQQLVRPAEGDQPAVVRIEDPQNGADKYAFEITWRREGFAPPPPPVETGRREGGIIAGVLRRLGNEEALDVCRREVRRRLADRYRNDDIAFREIRIDDAPGRGEWIVGIADAGRDRRDAFRFSCYVNFQTGEVRSAQIDPLRVRLTTDQALDVCRGEIRRRLADRFRPDDVYFREIRIDPAPGRAEWIVGIVDTGRDRRGGAMRFSCYVNFDTGEIRNAQLDPLRARMPVDQAVDLCRREVRRQSAERFRSDDINFRDIRLDDGPGRNDWVIGSLDVRRDGRDQPVRFSCSVDFEAGQLRSVQIDPFRGDR